MKPILSSRWKAALFIGGLLAVLASTIGCGSMRRGEPIVGTLPVSDSQMEQGRLVFYRDCHSCHPGGEGGLGPPLNDKPLPRFLMKTQVRAGLGVMPSFDKHAISPEEMDHLMKYLLALRRHDKKSVEP